MQQKQRVAAAHRSGKRVQMGEMGVAGGCPACAWSHKPQENTAVWSDDSGEHCFVVVYPVIVLVWPCGGGVMGVRGLTYAHRDMVKSAHTCTCTHTHTHMHTHNHTCKHACIMQAGLASCAHAQTASACPCVTVCASGAPLLQWHLWAVAGIPRIRARGNPALFLLGARCCCCGLYAQLRHVSRLPFQRPPRSCDAALLKMMDRGGTGLCRVECGL